MAHEFAFMNAAALRQCFEGSEKKTRNTYQSSGFSKEGWVQKNGAATLGVLSETWMAANE